MNADGAVHVDDTFAKEIGFTSDKSMTIRRLCMSRRMGRRIITQNATTPGACKEMSVVDVELDEPEFCEEHGEPVPCRVCRADLDDLYSDMKHQDSIDS